ncbi:MAG: glycerol-3-phosphate 1-O-acyltransferase PlsY [Azospirillaceae bacterium]
MPDLFHWGVAWPYFLSALVGGYLLGSLPFGLVLVRLAGLGDVRAIGSGNIGATNVLRTGRRGLALATLLLDGGKGAAAALIAGRYGTDVMVLAGFGAVLGHCFPVWLRFRGGKGMATAIGTLLAVSPTVGILVSVVWLAVALVTRYSSLASLISVAAAPLLAYLLSLRAVFEPLAEAGFGMALLGDNPRTLMALAIAMVVWVRHWKNIVRLVSGRESRIGQR